MALTRVALTRSASPRLWAYLAIAALGFFGAMATGRAELAVAAAPLALVALAGVVLAERPELSARLVLATDRTIEGTPLTGTVVVTTDLPRGRLDLVVPTTGPLVLTDPLDGAPNGPAWVSWGGGTERTLPFAGTTSRWGVVRIGPVWLRAQGPLGLVRWQGPLGGRETVRVLPTAVTLRSLLPHPDPRTASGSHLARHPGPGIEFADARPYQPGDRLRSMNWPLSTRRGELWVNEHRPERSADLVILVDTFADDATDGSLALGRSARAAWLLAQAHLAAHDRVGLVTFGGYPAWITPGSGERGRYAFLDRLLTTSAAWTEAQRPVDVIPRQVVPAGASLVAVTPLHDRRMVTALVELRRRGQGVAAVRVEATDAVVTPANDAWSAAVRLFRLELERRAEILADAGVPVVTWPAGEDAAATLQALRRVGRAPVLRRAGA